MLNFDYVYYATPNLAVKENLDEETLSDTTIFPTDETLANCEVYKQYDNDKVIELSLEKIKVRIIKFFETFFFSYCFSILSMIK